MGKIDFSVGEFDTRVQFYKQEITRTDAGAIVKDFIKTTEAFAGVSSKTLDETVGEARIRVVEVLELTSYLLVGMNYSWRVEIGGNMYEVISVEPVKRRFMKVVLKQL